jgi:hypothetical protein
MKRLHCENPNNPNCIASGISGSVCVNHLWPVVAGGGGMKDEALKLALAALETELAVDMTNGAEVGEAAELMCEAITAIKQALAAQPMQEPDLIARLKHPDDHYEFINPKKANAVLMSLCQEAADALAAPVQERTDYAVHLNHCNIGECEGVCKYLDDDCPALEHADMKAKWDRPTPPAAQQEHEPENEPYVSLASVQEPVAWAVVGEGEWGEWVIGQQFETNNPPNHEYWKNRGYLLVPLYTTPPAQPAVPDAIGPNEDELPAYAAGWNDCRQAMLEMMK